MVIDHPHSRNVSPLSKLSITNTPGILGRPVVVPTETEICSAV